MRPFITVLLVAALSAIACGPPKPVKYRLPQLAALPIGAQPITDARTSFADLFCGVLPHTDGQWDGCERYLHLDRPAAPVFVEPADAFLSHYRVLIVGGIFARCLDVTAFEDAAKHLADAHQVRAEHLPVYGNGSSEQNAALIRDHVLASAASPPYIVVGHSKGGIDLLETLVRHPEVRPRVAALVTVASPVAGSRLVDAVPDLLKAMALRLPDIGGCPLGDRRGHQSLSRQARQEFFRDHLKDVNQVRSYSVAAVASEENTSRILHVLWRYQQPFSLDQDSHVIADDAVLPGSTFLAQANGDHWAVASPMELSGNKLLREGANRNHYPRAALLESVLRHVARDLSTTKP